MECNQQKMREALVKLRTEIERFYNNEWIPYNAWQGCDDMISHTLSAPPRQCDVGTAEEQNDRFLDFCSEYHDTGCYDCDGNPLCPVAGESDCKLAWAQTPYEAKEGAGE